MSFSGVCRVAQRLHGSAARRGPPSDSIGPNGAGKTTFFDAGPPGCAGHQRAARSSSTGTTSPGIRPWRARVRGVFNGTFQRQQVFGRLTVEENLADRHRMARWRWRHPGGSGRLPSAEADRASWASPTGDVGAVARVAPQITRSSTCQWRLCTWCMGFGELAARLCLCRVTHGARWQEVFGALAVFALPLLVVILRWLCVSVSALWRSRGGSQRAVGSSHTWSGIHKQRHLRFRERGIFGPTIWDLILSMMIFSGRALRSPAGYRTFLLNQLASSQPPDPVYVFLLGHLGLEFRFEAVSRRGRQPFPLLGTDDGHEADTHTWAPTQVVGQNPESCLQKMLDTRRSGPSRSWSQHSKSMRSPLAPTGCPKLLTLPSGLTEKSSVLIETPRRQSATAKPLSVKPKSSMRTISVGVKQSWTSASANCWLGSVTPA